MAVTVKTVDALISAINGNESDIIIESGTYTLTTRLVSKALARKLIGRGNVILNFVRVPNGTFTNPTVCLDFQNKSRIFNITIQINPSSATPQHIIGVRYKLIVNYKYQLIGNPTTNTLSNIPSVSENNTFTFGGRVYSSNDNIVYYYPITDQLADTAKTLVKTYAFQEISKGVYGWELEKGADEADMDSSLINCKFLTNLTDFSSRGIIAVDYHGRNIESDGCTFTNLGTGIRLQFPRNNTLSAPSSATNLNQNGFYGHRKARLYKNTFTGVSRAFHITGDVTLRGAIITDNVIGSSKINNSGGQLIYCDGNGGIKSSVISSNTVYNHNTTTLGYSSTILFTSGLFENNIVSSNNFFGRPSDVMVFTSTCKFLGNIISSNDIGDAYTQGMYVNNCYGLLATGNKFSISGIANITLSNSITNVSIVNNTSVNNSRSTNTFLNFSDGIYSRFIISKNVISSLTNIFRYPSIFKFVRPYLIQTKKF